MAVLKYMLLLFIWLKLGEQMEEHSLEVTFERSVKESRTVFMKEENLAAMGRIEDEQRADVRFGTGARDPAINLCTRQLHQRQLPFETAFDEINRRNESNIQQAGPAQCQVEENCSNSLNGSSCDPESPYRNVDGTCNNLKHPTWGSTFTCYQRMLKASYEGSSAFRVSVDGSALPNPRLISEVVHFSSFRGPMPKQSNIFTFFGQFLTHDLALASQVRTSGNKAILCCPEALDVHPNCAPISISSDDRFYSKFHVTCMNFVRSALCPTCRLEARKQLNEVTAFIDASAVYGNTVPESEALRENDGTGRLKSQKTSFGELLPLESDRENDPCSFLPSGICYKAGDARVNQHSSLASIHTLFLREHNRVADELQRINPYWDDETLFQESRRIVIAELQHIVYNEYLPAIIHTKIMSRFRLPVLRVGTTTYNSKLKPNIYTEFATSAFRFGHSMVDQDVYNSTKGSLRFNEDYFQVAKLQKPGVVDFILKGITFSPTAGLDRILVTDVKELLYRFPIIKLGLDLAAIDIQRGRDHGIPPYAELFKHCSGNKRALRDFNDLLLYGLMREDVVNLLASTYTDVNDIDLWTGILGEGSITFLGPVGACIVGLQFHVLKYGDRFYFEHGDQAGSFTAEQLRAIKRVSFSRMMCANTNARKMPLKAFFRVRKSNPLICCEKLPPIDLSAWESEIY